MTTLQTELNRLYFSGAPPSQDPATQEPSLIAPDGTVRAMVLELGRPADWNILSAVWRGVQTDLELPAPAIAVSGVDAYQLWFSLSAPVPVTQAWTFLESLRVHYLGTVAPARIRMMPSADLSAPQEVRHARLIPALQKETGLWSAFVAPDLASIFSEEPWLDLAPNPDAQANVLSHLESIKPAVFQAALEQIGPAVSVTPAGLGMGSIPQESGRDPHQFLLDVMNNQAIELHHRIEAAKALLPYSQVRKGL
jgi:hypothetical protein